MRTSGSSIGKLGLSALLLMGLVGVAVAAEVSTAEIPEGVDAYVVTATLAPGQGGAEVCGVDHDNGHVDFRIGFGADGRLTMNGVDAGPFDPNATYTVTVQCTKQGPSWFASTTVVNAVTNEAVCQQVNYKMPGAAREARAAAADLEQLGVN